MTSWQQFFGIVRVIDRLVGEHFLINPLAIHQRQSHFRNLRSQKWIAFDIGLEPAVDHRLEAATSAVNRYDEEIARIDSGSLQSFNRTDSHIVIVDEDALEILACFVFLQEGLHHRESFRAGEVARLGI